MDLNYLLYIPNVATVFQVVLLAVLSLRDLLEAMGNPVSFLLKQGPKMQIRNTRSLANVSKTS